MTEAQLLMASPLSARYRGENTGDHITRYNSAKGEAGLSTRFLLLPGFWGCKGITLCHSGTLLLLPRNVIS